MATLQAAINQYNQINSVLPQLQAENSILQWLMSVFNKGETMQALSQNLPIRNKQGFMELANTGEVDYHLLNQIAGDKNHPLHFGVRSASRIIDKASQVQSDIVRRRTGGGPPVGGPGDVKMEE
jgi:hypothetical protein